MGDEFVESVRYEADISDIQSKLTKLSGDQNKLESDTEVSTGKMTKHWASLKSGLGAAASAIGYGLLGIGGAAIAFAPKILEGGAELEALGKKSETVFSGGSLSKVQAWADSVAGSLGLTSAKAIGLAAGIGDLLKPMGFTADQAAGMSTGLVDLSGALSAWSGGTKSAAEVSDTLMAALLGETDGLKGLGISISAADVQARLAKNGTDGLTGAALEQAKAIATQQLIMEKSTDAQAAWSNGSMDSIKQQNASKASLGQLGETFTKLLYPAVQAILPVVQKVASWLGDHLPGAIATAKQWFDVHLLPVVQKVVGWVRDNWPQIQQAIQQVLTAVGQGIQGFITFVSEAWDKWGGTIMAVVDAVWPPIQEIIGGTIEAIRGIIKTVTDLITGDWDGAWNGIKDIVSGVWKAIKGGISLVLAEIGLIISNAWAAIKSAAQTVWDGIKAIPGLAWDAIKAYFKLEVEVLKGIIGAIWTGITDAAQAVWDGIKAIPSVAWEGIKAYFNLQIRALTGIFGLIWSGISTAASTAWEGIKTTVSGAVDGVVGFVTGIPGRLADGAATLFDGIKTGITSAKDWVQEKANGIVTFIGTLPSMIADKAIGMWDGIKSAFKAAINWIIKGWNGIQFTMPSINLGPLGTFGGWTVGLPDIPLLHSGGTFNSGRGEGLALLKDGETVRTTDQEADVQRRLNGQSGGVTIHQLTVNTTETPRRWLDESLWRLAG